MGKTRRTTREYIDELRDDLDRYHQALRRRHQHTFDDVWGHARYFSMPIDAGDKGHNTDWLILLSICVGQHEQIQELEEQVAALEHQVETLAEERPASDSFE